MYIRSNSTMGLLFGFACGSLTPGFKHERGTYVASPASD